MTLNIIEDEKLHMKEKEKIPTYMDLLWPTLKVLGALGRSASIREISEELASYLKLPDSILDIPHNPKYGSESEFDNRAGWARTYLRKVGAVDISSRGVWVITELGRKIGAEGEIRERVRSWIQKENKEYHARRKGIGKSGGENGDDGISNEEEWTEPLLDILRSMSPKAFEHLCKRVLREKGFMKVKGTPLSGDDGIDGTGVLRINLLSFRIAFQCKRYSGSVGPGEIRNFQGAVVGNADKGLFITTGRFSKKAEQAAVRAGAPAIDLIDGNEFCDLLKELELGVKVEEIVEPQRDFFDSFSE